MLKKKLHALANSVKKSTWPRQLLTTFIGTLLSITLTFGVSSWKEARQKQADRHLAALMVLGNIEAFARNLEAWQKENSPIDNACTIMLQVPVERFYAMPDDSLDYYADLLMGPAPTAVGHDNTAEQIFANNIETWKNVGNAIFIQKVGELFSIINRTKHDLDDFGKQASNYYREAMENNQGSMRDATISFLTSTGLHETMLNAHYAYVDYSNYIIDYLRYWNSQCMEMIGVTEQEIDDHLEGLGELKRLEQSEPDIANDKYHTSPMI